MISQEACRVSSPCSKELGLSPRCLAREWSPDRHQYQPTGRLCGLGPAKTLLHRSWASRSDQLCLTAVAADCSRRRARSAATCPNTSSATGTTWFAASSPLPSTTMGTGGYPGGPPTEHPSTYHIPASAKAPTASREMRQVMQALTR